METIRNYLENMFMNLPRTKEVMKAKFELGQMMEDKYNELKSEGKSDNEAIGVVISEFGNLEDIAEELGIHDFIHPAAYSEKKTIGMDVVKSYIPDCIQSSVRIAIAVLLCICCSVPIIILESFADNNMLGYGVAEAIGVTALFAFLAIAVGMFIYNHVNMKKWDYIKGEALQLDFATEQYVREQMENFRPAYALYLTVGVVLCIASVVPAAVIGCLDYYNPILEDASGALVLIFVAIGVMFLIMGAMRQKCYELLVQVDNAAAKEATYKSSLEKNIMSVYWPTVTCLYLIWSFLSYRWDITWIIWPLAAVVNRIIKIILEERR